MGRFEWGLLLAAGVWPAFALAGCTVRVDEPARPARVEIDADPPPAIDVDVNVKKKP